MYVYKKKCDEEYYISIIRSTQQQFMYQNPANRAFPTQTPVPYYNNSYPGPMPYPNNNSLTPNFNSNNYYNPFKTPENRNYNYSYNNYYNNIPYKNNNGDLNERSPSPIRSRAEMKYGYHNNGTKKHLLEDQILYNKLNHINGISINHSNPNMKKVNDEYRYNLNPNNQNRNYNNNFNNFNYVNKKVFRLEDFLSESKKNNLSDRFNRAAKDDFN